MAFSEYARSTPMTISPQSKTLLIKFSFHVLPTLEGRSCPMTFQIEDHFPSHDQVVYQIVMTWCIIEAEIPRKVIYSFPSYGHVSTRTLTPPIV